MDPATIGAVSMGASGAGSLLGISGALSSAKAQSRMYTYQAGIANLNKMISEQNRDYALQAGSQEAEIYGIKSRQQIGATKAAQSASGANVNVGSAVAVQESEHEVARMDLNTIRANAARVAYGYGAEASVYGAQAGLYQQAAADVKKAGWTSAMSSLLSGVSSVSSKWLQGSQTGLW